MNKTNIATMFGATDVSTFLGLPSCASPDQVNAKAAILGVPCATPYASVGPYCAGGPAAIRAAAAPYAANLEHMDFDFAAPLLPGGRQDACDLGDLGYGDDSASNRAAIKTAVSTVVDRGAVPIVLGGDDSIPIPMLQAFEGRGKYTIVQIDAHIDWRDEVDGERWGLSSTMRRASEMDHIERIIQVGARNIGSARPRDYADALAWGTAPTLSSVLTVTGLIRRSCPVLSGVRLVALVTGRQLNCSMQFPQKPGFPLSIWSNSCRTATLTDLAR